MAKLLWDVSGTRKFETGVDHGVLYKPDSFGAYPIGYAWQGLTTVTESPSGAEPQAQWADNMKYLNLYSYEEFGLTIEAFTYPDEWAEHDGSAEPEIGVQVSGQTRKPFGFSYRTKVGTDTDPDLGYKIHLVYGCTASPSEKARATVNDSPEALNFSWDVATLPVAVTGLKPTSYICVDSTRVPSSNLAALEDILYGTVGNDPQLPLPDDVIALFAGSVTVVTPGVPTYNSTTDIITIPSTTGVIYKIDGVVVPAGSFGPITSSKVVHAYPAAGYKFAVPSDDDWLITFV